MNAPAVTPIKRFKLTGGSLTKAARLNPYKRITKGTTITIGIDDVTTEAIIDTAGKYTYLNVKGVDYYVTGALVDGEGYASSEFVQEPPKAKEPKAVKPDSGKADKGKKAA